MKKSFLRIAVLLLLFLPGCYNILQAQECSSAGCHASIVERPHVHPAAEDCENCHEATDESHPVKGRKTFRLVEKGSGLCNMCHEEFGDFKYQHAPVSQGKCTACHDPHGSANEKLLVMEYPSGPYVTYTDKEYQLCFSCHKRDLLLFPDTSFATGFRDGERNLHYLHVHKEKRGLTCSLCHKVHAGDLSKLIADTVPYGRWKLPLHFRKTDNGGSCAPGCHKKTGYDRRTRE